MCYVQTNVGPSFYVNYIFNLNTAFQQLHVRREGEALFSPSHTPGDLMVCQCYHQGNTLNIGYSFYQIISYYKNYSKLNLY